mmetsp:Transcript_19609/g.22527  ORF Transcript_19609/g.22527 Transcript_19609/m.22527 type:complete len:699 (+) Transcript_19609:34-2130(+)
MPSRRFLIVSLLSLGVLCSLFVVYDNTDRSVRNWINEENEIYMFASKNPEFLKALLEAKQNPIENIAFDSDDYAACLKDELTMEIMSSKEQLESFVEGNCAPIIMVPGITGTKLMVEIDCEVLQEKRPDIMEACGWDTCSSWVIFGNKPNTEYLLWVPRLLSPMSIVSIQDHECFGKMMGFDYNKTGSETHLKYGGIEGLEVTWYGNTPETYFDADGGFNAVQDMLPFPIQTQGTKEFRGLADNFVKMGYQKGLSLFAIPYDFRLTHMANSVRYTLERTIRYAYELTGKKVVIVSHSLGNINTLPVLNKMSQEDKDKMIAAYVAVTPPFGGASAPVRTFVGGDERMLYKNLIGMQVSNQKHVMKTFSSLYELLPEDTFFRFKDEPWMKELIERVEAEEKYDIRTLEGWRYWNQGINFPLPWFPNPAEDCFEGFINRPKECRTLITDLTKQPVAIIEGEKYYARTADMVKLIKNHFHFSDREFAVHQYIDSFTSNKYVFENPGVPVVYIYASHVPTEITNEWYYDPDFTNSYPDFTTNYRDIKIRLDDFAFPDRTVNKYGDDRVEVSYSLPVALKWAWENRNNVSNAKPIKVVEYCSTYNSKTKVTGLFDGTAKTEYMGLPCQCWDVDETTGENCDHTKILQDENFYELVKNVAITGQKVVKKPAVYSASEDLIDGLIHSLPHLRASKGQQNVKDWLYE